MKSTAMRNSPFIRKLKVTSITQMNLQSRIFFYNMGFISSIFYFMASTDMHFENVIVDGQKPFFIDLETISDLTDFETASERNDLFLTLSNSVFQSMIYPFEMTDNYLNISALTGEQGEVTNFHYKNTVPTINPNGELDFSEVNPALERQKNEIFLDDQKQLPSMYLEVITRGFADFCKQVLDKPEETYERLIHVMKGFPIRQIIRPTHVYAKYLNIGTEPYYLRNEKNFSELFQHLGNSTSEIIYEEETKHLKNGDIPFFYTYADSKDLYSGGELLSSNYFSRTIKDNIWDRISSFTKEKLDQEISHISSSLFIHHYNYVKEHAESERTKSIKHQDPIQYVEEFMRKFKQVNESYSALLPSFSGEKMIISPVTPSIFDYGGNILLAVYFREEVGLELDNLKRIFATMKKWNTFTYEELSGFNGVSGYLYLLYTTYKMTGESYFYNQLLQEIDHVLAKDTKEAKNLDYFTGISGSISILSEIYADMEESLQKVRLLDFLTFYTHYLKKNLQQMHDSDSRIGLSHGYSGVIIALSRFDRSTESNENQPLIQELIAIEESYYLVEQNNYLDLRDQTAGKYYLCYGLVGILFSRLELYGNGYIYLKEEIQARALRLLNDLKNETINLNEYSYCICHGIGGFIELFQEIERLELIGTEKLAPVYDLLFKQLKLKQKNGVGNTLHYDSFMLGAGGPVYNHLRKMYDFPSFIGLKTTFSNRTLNLS
ncbi:type 2 lanthipeptide synthetase LanM [Paraliobacillus zengyii]|uniref:type 2 lanthipeptide synthetase LanM n=1 Tax=Paraliobacillus zengyii TaxID=2213194 RepID=UPI000DD49DCF